jgi:hypothetical protein
MTTKRMTAKEFRELGLLQEVNRLFLHPMGLALECVIEDDGTEHFGQVWDSRDDPEGFVFAEAAYENKKQKVDVVNALFEAKRKVREAKFGWHIQPLDIVADSIK